MSRKTLRLDRMTEELYSVSMHNSTGDNRERRRRMKSFIKKAMQQDLTERQSYCIEHYFLYEMSMSEIAKELQISVSAVSRHIKRGINVLKKRTIYFDS